MEFPFNEYFRGKLKELVRGSWPLCIASSKIGIERKMWSRNRTPAHHTPLRGVLPAISGEGPHCSWAWAPNWSVLSLLGPIAEQYTCHSHLCGLAVAAYFECRLRVIVSHMQHSSLGCAHIIPFTQSDGGYCRCGHKHKVPCHNVLGVLSCTQRDDG